MLRFSRVLFFAGVMLLSACAHDEGMQNSSDEQLGKIAFSSQNMWLGTDVSRSGVHYCPNIRRCTGDPLLPPEPCIQPMPTYYNDISELTVADGVLLIHPMTRKKVLCLDQPGMGAMDCVERFQNQGYVLITDVPQFQGKYDFLKEGSYPSRKWRKGESVPRF